jgi:beta-lactamase class A
LARVFVLGLSVAVFAAACGDAVANEPAGGAVAEVNPGEWRVLANRLQPVIDAAASDGITMGLFVSELRGGDPRVLYLGKQGAFSAASTIKLALAAAVLRRVEAGVLALGDEVVIGEDELTSGTGVLKDLEAPGGITVGGLLELRIQVSDNTATNKLVDVVGGFGAVDEVVAAAGLPKEAMHFGRKMWSEGGGADGDNWVTPFGCKVFLGGLCAAAEGAAAAAGFLSAASAGYLIRLMRGQKVKTKLGAVVPGNILAHKTGESIGLAHDVGILFLSKRELAIGVFAESGGELGGSGMRMCGLLWRILTSRRLARLCISMFFRSVSVLERLDLRASSFSGGGAV